MNKESNMNDEIDLWDSPDQESLHGYTTKDEAIEMILDDMEIDPETIIVCGYKRMELNIDHCYPLENLLEWLDDDYGDPDEATGPTSAMLEAEEVFLAAVKKEYMVWSCKEVCRETVNVAQWRREKA
jgi:hypothetical protein